MENNYQLCDITFSNLILEKAVRTEVRLVLSTLSVEKTHSEKFIKVFKVH